MLSSETPISIEYLTNDGTNHRCRRGTMQQDFAALGIRSDHSVSGLERLPAGAQKNGNYEASAVKAGLPTSTTRSTCSRCGSPPPATMTASLAVPPSTTLRRTANPQIKTVSPGGDTVFCIKIPDALCIGT